MINDIPLDATAAEALRHAVEMIDSGAYRSAPSPDLIKFAQLLSAQAARLEAARPAKPDPSRRVDPVRRLAMTWARQVFPSGPLTSAARREMVEAAVIFENFLRGRFSPSTIGTDSQ